MTATGMSDGSAPIAVGNADSSEDPAESSAALATAVADGTDPDTLRRLRQTLRILLAARRRDDGMHISSDDN